MNSVLVISHEPIAANMAGPPIRYLEIARSLGKELRVTLAVPASLDLPEREPFRVLEYVPESLCDAVEDYDIVLISGFLLPQYPFLKNIPGALVLDIYDPVIFEYLELNKGSTAEQQKFAYDRFVLNFREQMRAGDFFICACEPQRALWIGMLSSAYRINPVTFAGSRQLRSLIDLVPFGLPETAPQKTRPVLKGVQPGIGKDDFVILWGGGIYDWLDPMTAVRAMSIVHRERPDIKLFFMGCKYPNPEVNMLSTHETIRLSDSLGLSGKAVFFNDWVPYSERADYLLEADLGLCLHHESIETDFSFRTRILDYIWTELPTVTTRGGAISELVAREQLGFVVDYEDDEGLARCILSAAADKNLLERFKENNRRRRNEFTWTKAVEPLARFCRNPTRRVDEQFLVEKWSVTSPYYYYKRLIHIYRTQHLRGILARLALSFIFKLIGATGILIDKLETPHFPLPRLHRLKHRLQMAGHRLYTYIQGIGA